MSAFALLSVSVDGFRNLDRVRFEPGIGTTVLHGPNGAGKTNVLDAIHFALTGASFRGGYARDSVGFESDAMRVELEVEDGGEMHRIVCAVSRSGERLREIDGRALGASELGRRVEVFHPDLLQLVKGPPALRRAFVDALAASLKPHHSDLRSAYGRTLAQRNSLARRVVAGAAQIAALATWDDRLAELGASLCAERSSTIQSLNEAFPGLAASLGFASASVLYKPSASTQAAEIGKRLAELRSTGELGRSYLRFGPHMDELELRAAERPIRRFASQGQQRVAVLALLLAERRVLSEAGRPAPILLLDDVTSELDPEHRDLLAESVRGGQAILTATEPAQVPLPDSAASGEVVRIQVRDGEVVSENPGGALAA